MSTDPILIHTLFTRINELHFRGELPLPKLQWNSRLRSSAGRFIPGYRPRKRNWVDQVLGVTIQSREPVIEVASYLLNEADRDRHLWDTVAHEMIHYWLWYRRKSYGHTPEFYAKMRELGVSRYNPVPKVRPPKHLYVCPACAKDYPARRRLGRVACLSCCNQFAGGRFDVRFALVLSK